MFPALVIILTCDWLQPAAGQQPPGARHDGGGPAQQPQLQLLHLLVRGPGQRHQDQACVGTLPDSPIENIDHNLRRKRGSSSSSEAEEEEGEDEQCGAAFFGIQENRAVNEQS